MASGCLRHTDLPHTSRLFADFVYHFDRLSKFYAYNPLDKASYLRAAERLNYPDERRQALVAALRELNPDSPQLRKLAQPGTVAVVTGQQVGLFSGPSYTVYKALTAAKLAAELEASGTPAVPVFWLATEDHDFEEVSHAFTLSTQQQPLRHQVELPDLDHTPVGGVQIADYGVDELASALAGLPYADEVIADVKETYKPGATMRDAFLGLVERLLSRFGLIFIDPMQPAIREIAAPLMAEAVMRGDELSARLLKRNEELGSAGYHAQVHVEGKTSLFFLLEGGKRLTLHREGSDYLRDDRRISKEELASQSAHLSPNALLRPVVQDYLLPTVALVGGPAEVAYLAQTEVIYEALGRPVPVIVPRSQFTLLDARSVKLLKRYRLTVKDCLDGIEGLNAKIAQRVVPEQLAHTLAESRVTAAAVLDKLVNEVGSFDKTLGDAAAKSRAKILYQIGKIEAKTAREALRHNERAAADASHLFHLLYPEKHLQERLYTILPFIARYGSDLIDRLYDEVRLDCPDHLVVEV